jgi:hypothetical protein
MLLKLPTSRLRPDAKSAPPSAASTHRTPAPVLVTVQQVAFSTAAAAPVAPTLRRWLDTTPIAHVRGVMTALIQPRPRSPRREAIYFQTARMSREMERL